MDAVLQFLKSVEINDIFDISLVTICIYSVLLTIQKTRAVQIIQGVGVILLLLLVALLPLLVAAGSRGGGFWFHPPPRLFHHDCGLSFNVSQFLVQIRKWANFDHNLYFLKLN